jgi:hypothetical protein
MHAMMFYEMALINECLITPIKSIRAVTIMNALMCPGQLMPYYTHHKYRGGYHNECIDVL